MKSSQILKKARKLIASDEVYFICNAVHSVGRDTNCIKESNKIEEFISLQLEGYVGLGGWLKHRYGIIAHTDNEKFKQTRLNWIDHMIKLYKAKGD